MSTMSMQSPAADFPVSWENPSDAKLFWQPEPHLKTPIHPLSFTVVATFYEGCNPGWTSSRCHSTLT